MKTAAAWILFRTDQRNHAWPVATTTVADDGRGYNVTCHGEHAIAQALGYTEDFDEMLDYIENNEDDGSDDDGPEPGEEPEDDPEEEEEPQE